MEVIVNSLSIDTIKPDPRSHHRPKGSEMRTQTHDVRFLDGHNLTHNSEPLEK